MRPQVPSARCRVGRGKTVPCRVRVQSPERDTAMCRLLPVHILDKGRELIRDSGP